MDDYFSLYQQSIEHPELFWHQQAKTFLTWSKPWKQVVSGDFMHLPVRWFEGAQLNACYNCVDRHLPINADKIAILFQGNEKDVSYSLTYAELHQKICQAAKGLKNFGVKKGDRVGIYLPMIPEAVIAVLACARIGAIHTVVFGGFSAHALRQRLIDAQCCVVITANYGLRGGKIVPLKENVDVAVEQLDFIKAVVVVNHVNKTCAWNNKNYAWESWMRDEKKECPVTPMQSTDPLFLLYTSGSTGKPKGILHSTGGYLLHAASSFHYVFNVQPHEIFWCTADIGWITGHTYGIYGPLCNAATVLMYEGIPTYPSAERYWEIIEKYRVNIFYTAPTALRMLMREGNEAILNHSRNSLRLLGSVGEPLNPEAWRWYHEVVGESRCPIVDTWWQTETGAVALCPFPATRACAPGQVGLPFFGIKPEIIQNELYLSQPWPGLMMTIYKDPERFKAYFAHQNGYYFTGDGASVDQEGNFTITGRTDDVIKISGHRIGSAEIESALLLHPAVCESAAVGVDDEIKGQRIYAFVVLKVGHMPSEILKNQLIQTVASEIGAIAKPDTIHWTTLLPKTRSGKIMRRILRKIAQGQWDELGDLSTLADPEAIEGLRGKIAV